MIKKRHLLPCFSKSHADQVYLVDVGFLWQSVDVLSYLNADVRVVVHRLGVALAHVESIVPLHATDRVLTEVLGHLRKLLCILSFNGLTVRYQYVGGSAVDDGKVCTEHQLPISYRGAYQAK